MALNDFCVDCTDDYCVDAVLPPLAVACAVTNGHPVEEVFFTDQGHPVTGDPTQAASWTTRLSNTSDGTGSGSGNVAHPIRHFAIVNGQKPAGTPTYIKNQAGTQATLDKYTRSITFFDDDNSDAKYAMYRGYQCNGNVLLYYRSGKHFYGGSAGAGNGVGIACVIKPVHAILPGSTDGGAHRWIVTIEWDARCEEDRFTAPL
ncbi:hypothetical protein [Spirosoma litoris]